jgi:excisionase family DNA binding protein
MSRTKVTSLENLPDIMSPQQAADYVGIARQRVYDLCQFGEIKSFTIGASRKIMKSDLLDWIGKVRGAAQ